MSKWSTQSAVVAWTVLAVAVAPVPTSPTVSLTSEPAASTTATSATFEWTSTNASSTTCVVDGGSATPCGSPDTIGNLSVGGHTFSVTVDNSAGTDSASYSWTVTTDAATSDPPQSGGTTRDVYPGGSIASAVASSAPGDTVVVHAGTYPQTNLTSAFTGTPVVITGAAGESVLVGGFDLSGASGITISHIGTNGQSLVENGSHDIVFDHVGCAIPAGDTSHSCFYIRGTSHDVTISHSSATGGWDEVKLYGSGDSNVGYGIHNVSIFGNDLSRANEDDIHVDGAANVLVEGNYIHDPVDNTDHNDGIQTQASDRLTIDGNTFSFTTVPATGGPNQAMMLGNVPAQFPTRLVTNTRVVNNLVAHWNGGRPLIMNGTTGTVVVNNTFVDSGNASVNDPSITVSNQGAAGGQNPGLEIWNNILKSVYYDSGSTPPAFFDTNLETDPYSGMAGTHVITASPQFVDRTTYALASTSPAVGAGLVISGTPTVDITGATRRWPPNLGARG